MSTKKLGMVLFLVLLVTFFASLVLDVSSSSSSTDSVGPSTTRVKEENKKRIQEAQQQAEADLLLPECPLAKPTAVEDIPHDAIVSCQAKAKRELNGRIHYTVSRTTTMANSSNTTRTHQNLLEQKWNHVTQSVERTVLDPLTGASTKCRRPPTKGITTPMTSLEILESILHDNNYNDNDDCFVPSSKIPIPTTVNRSAPIFHVGFPKSGTTTLAQYFACAGYTTAPQELGQCVADAIGQHHCTHPLDTCTFGGQVVAQLDITRPPFACYYPQIQFLDEIHAEHPNAIFLLLMRPIQDWVDSVKNWFDMEHRLNFCEIPGLYPQEGPDSLLTEDDLKQWACTHVRHIRQFVQTYPSHTLMELDLYNATETTATLGRLFGGQPSCWGHENSSQNRTAAGIRKKRNIINKNNNNSINTTRIPRTPLRPKGRPVGKGMKTGRKRPRADNQ